MELRELQGAVEDIRYRKRDDGERYVHDVESENDLWLVEVDGRKGTLMVPRDRTPMWTKDGDTYWLNNPPRARGKRGAMARRTKKAKTRRRSTTRRKAKRPPPAGFKSWSAYMASIRPSSTKGDSMAARRKRRSSAKRTRPRRRRRVASARANPPKRSRRRRSYRRNPQLIPSVGSVITRVKRAAIGGVAILAGESAARLTRSRLLGMPAGTMTAAAVEFGAGTVAGLVAEKVFGQEVGQNVTNGAFAGVFRAAAKQLGTQYNLPFVSEALGDAGGRGRRRFAIKNGRVVPLAGYVGTGANRLDGYVGAGNNVLAGYEDQDEIYGAN